MKISVQFALTFFKSIVYKYHPTLRITSLPRSGKYSKKHVTQTKQGRVEKYEVLGTSLE